MSTSRLLFLCAGLIVSASMAVTLQVHVRVREANHARARLDHAVRETAAQIKVAEEEVKTLQTRYVDLQGILQKLNTELAKYSGNKGVSITELIEQDPRMQLLSSNARRATLEATYAPLFRQLEMSPAEIKVFEDLVLRHDEEVRDIQAGLRKQGLTLEDPASTKLNQELQARYENDQRALLGDHEFQRWKEYERSSAIRNIVAGVAGAATVLGTPFSSETAEKLVGLITTSSPNYQKGESAYPETIDWEVVDAQAREILSDEQYIAFTTMEPLGPNNAGARALTQLNAVITKAAEADRKALLKPRAANFRLASQ